MRRTIVLLTAVLLWSVGGAAQRQGGAPSQGATPPTPIRIQVTITEVKPDMLGVYDDLIKNEANPALKKSGVQYRWMFQNFISGKNNVRISVQPVVNMAQYDQGNPIRRAVGDAAYTAYLAKLRSTVVTAETKILTLQRNLSVFSNVTAPPPHVQVQVIQIVPGRGPDFANIMASDFLPNFKKLGLKDYWVYTTTFGGVQGEYTFVRPLEKFAEIDKGPMLTQAVGADAAAPINARRNALMTSSVITFESLLPDLSFGLPGKMTN